MTLEERLDDPIRSKQFTEGLDKMAFAIGLSDYSKRLYLMGRIFEIIREEIETGFYERR